MEYSPSAPLAPAHNSKSKNKVWLCLSIFFGVLVLAGLIILILALTVFKAKNPIITIESVTVDYLKSSVDPPPSTHVYLNLTLKLDISVYNPNMASFDYVDSSVILYYNGKVVGNAPLSAGDISSGGTKKMVILLTVMADRLLSDSSFYPDMLSGTLPFTAYTEISGKVTVLSIVKKHIVTHTSCDVSLNLRSSTVADSKCTTKIN